MTNLFHYFDYCIYLNRINSFLKVMIQTFRRDCITRWSFGDTFTALLRVLSLRLLAAPVYKPEDTNELEQHIRQRIKDRVRLRNT